jgi:hypothetical protein
VHSWSTFGVRTSHKQTQTPKTHHGPDLGEATTFPPYNILYVSPQDQHSNVILSRDSQMGVPKFPKLGLLQLWGPIILCADIRLKLGLKQSCSPHQDLSNNMWHTTYSHINRGNSWFLVVGSQIANLTPSPFFDHNLCFNYSNESWEPILGIYVLKDFQLYNEHFNSMGFDPCNFFLKICESIGTPTPKVEVHLGVWGFDPHTLPYSHIFDSMKCDSWASLLAHTFASPCLGREPKTRVAIIQVCIHGVKSFCIHCDVMQCVTWMPLCY